MVMSAQGRDGLLFQPKPPPIGQGRLSGLSPWWKIRGSSTINPPDVLRLRAMGRLSRADTRSDLLVLYRERERYLLAYASERGRDGQRVVPHRRDTGAAITGGAAVRVANVGVATARTEENQEH
jgi:hypothetical protein